MLRATTRDETIRSRGVSTGGMDIVGPRGCLRVEMGKMRRAQVRMDLLALLYGTSIFYVGNRKRMEILTGIQIKMWGKAIGDANMEKRGECLSKFDPR